MNFLYFILNNFDIIGPLFPIIIFLFKKKDFPPELRLVFIFCLIQLLCNTTAQIIGTGMKLNNYWVYKLNTIASFITLTLLFGKHLLKVSRTKLTMMVIVWLLFSFIPFAFGDGVITYNSYSAALSSIAIVAYCLYFFYIKLIQSSPEESVPSTPVFWCVIGLFTYYAGGFFIFISYKLLIEETTGNSVGRLWQFHNLLLFICCLYICYGIIWKNYQKISLSS
ncbi:hypothetical protein GCM10027051_35840 [Niabella terrae]